MNKHDEKVKRMKEHLITHQADYQTVVSLFKTESDSIKHERYQKKTLMMKEIMKFKKEGVVGGEQT